VVGNPKYLNISNGDSKDFASFSHALSIKLAAVFLLGTCAILHGKCSLIQLNTRLLTLVCLLAAKTLSHNCSSGGISMLSLTLFSDNLIKAPYLVTDRAFAINFFLLRKWHKDTMVSIHSIKTLFFLPRNSDCNSIAAWPK
jgi:hypothetical protein